MAKIDLRTMSTELALIQKGHDPWIAGERDGFVCEAKLLLVEGKARAAVAVAWRPAEFTGVDTMTAEQVATTHEKRTEYLNILRDLLDTEGQLWHLGDEE